MIDAIRQRRVRLERVQVILLAIAVLFAAASLMLAMGYASAAEQRDALAAQVSSVENAIQRLQARGANPGEAPGLQPGEDPFPAEVPTADLTNTLSQAAQQSGVQIESMTPQLSTGERLAQGTFRTYRISLRALGSPTQIADFLGRIERGTVRTWVLDNMQARPVVANTWDISLDVTAYARAATPTIR